MADLSGMSAQQMSTIVSLLQQAAEGGHEQEIESSLENIFIQATPAQRASMILFAVPFLAEVSTSDRKAMFEQIIRIAAGNIDLSLTDSNGHNIVQYATECGCDPSIIALLLRSSVNQVKATALNVLHSRYTSSISTDGSNINGIHPSSSGLTYLNYYISQGDVDAVQLMVDAGASVTATDSRGVSPQDMLDAIGEPEKSRISQILRSGPRQSSQLAAASSTSSDRIASARATALSVLHCRYTGSISTDGSNIDGTHPSSNPSMTYLNYYVSQGDVDAVQLMVDAGASVTAADSRGVTPRDMLDTIGDTGLKIRIRQILRL